MRRLLWCIMLLMWVWPVGAQGNFVEYIWEEADIALRYPAEWDAPLPESSIDFTQETLSLAQGLVASPATRPPAIPFITLTLLRDITDPQTAETRLREQLEAIGIEAGTPLPTTLANIEGIALNGSSADDLFVGTGRAIVSPQRGLLLVVGRSAAVSADAFTATFTALANSITFDVALGTAAPEYGALWVAGGQFVSPSALALAPDGTLIVADAEVGLLRLDADSGQVLSLSPFTEFVLPDDIAIAPDGRVLLADSNCQCVRVYQDDAEIETIGGFSQGAPRSIAFANDTLYATDFDNGLASVRVISPTDETRLIFEEQLPQQPLLSVNASGELLALLSDNRIFASAGVGFSPVFELQSGSLNAIDFEVDTQNLFYIATATQGILVVDTTGAVVNRVGELVAGAPRPGELVSPRSVAVATDGTIYWADTDGISANVTAVSLAVEAGRQGTTQLMPNSIVQGEMTPEAPQQIWTFAGQRGDVVLLSAIADFDALSLDLSLRLLAPDGSEVAFVDNQVFDPEAIDEDAARVLPIFILLNPFDAQLRDVELPRDGEYVIEVEAVRGSGGYTLGFGRAQSLPQPTEGVITVSGEVAPALPAQRWLYDAPRNATLTITMTATGANTTLDPILNVYDGRGNLIAQNDDAFNTTLGFNAQIDALALPGAGTYIIEAARINGEGAYQLEIEQN